MLIHAAVAVYIITCGRTVTRRKQDEKITLPVVFDAGGAEDSLLASSRSVMKIHNYSYYKKSNFL